MKKINIKLLFLVLAGGLLASSCYKKFDESSYQPPLDIGGFSNSREIAPGNLVGYWAFNGSLIDSVTGASCTNSGSSFTTGIKGQGYQGSANAYATFVPGTRLQNLKSFTIAFWMEANANTGAIGIFSLANTTDFWGNLDIYQDNGGSGDQTVFKVHINNANVPWAGQFTDGKVTIKKWIHIAATYDAATSKYNLYQNGVAIGVNSAGNPANTIGPTLNGSDPSAPPVTPYGQLKFVNPNAMVFGTFQFQTNPSLTGSAGPQGWATGFSGRLDEFRIYDRALTANEVSSLMLLEGRGK